MSSLIDDRVVDALGVIWEQSPGYVGPRVVAAPADLRVIRDFLSRETWQRFVQFITPGVLNHHGRVMEYSGFRFQSDLGPDDAPFEGVEMYDPIDTIYIGEGAFDRLMSRYFDAIIQGVVAQQRAELGEAWWQAFVGHALLLKRRARYVESEACRSYSSTLDRAMGDLGLEPVERRHALTAFTHEVPGHATRFWRFVPMTRHRDTLTAIDEALRVLRSLVRPLVIEVAQAVMDLDLGLPDSNAVLDAANVAVIFDTPIPPAAVDLTGLVAIRAEGRPLSVCIAQRDDAPDGHVVVVARGRVMASEARLPSFAGEALWMETRTGPVNVPVRRDHEGAWVAGPLPQTPTQPPIGMRWSYEGGVLDLDLVTGWSYWSEDPGGAYLVQQASIALIALDWVRK